MKTVTCPLCGGAGKINERDTLVGSSLVPRISEIDRAWDVTVHEEPTRLQTVPHFIRPRVVQSEEEHLMSTAKTPMRPPAKTSRRPQVWMIAVLFLSLGVGLGALAVHFEREIDLALNHLLGKL